MSEVSAAAEVPIGDLRPHPRNPRTISDVRFDHLKRTLTAEREMLQARPLIARRDGTVIAGNQRLAAAQALGWESIPVVYADIDDEQAEKWMLLDNRGFGEDDVELLAGMLRDLDARGTDLAEAGYLEDDVAAILLAAQPTSLRDPDEAPALPDEAKSVRGEVYELGVHRVMCGDATVDQHFAALYESSKIGCVLTDPPYGISLDTDYSKITGSRNSIVNHRGGRRVVAATYRPVEGDHEGFDASQLSALFADTREQFWFGANYYRRTLPGDDRAGSWLVWDKRPSGWNDEGAGIDDVIGSGFELIWSREKHQQRVLRLQWSGFTARNPGIARAHPTEKPVALLAEILERWIPAKAAVADPFAGVGTTLIACEQTGRRCFAMEIDPTYCDVIRQRYADYTDQPDLAP